MNKNAIKDFVVPTKVNLTIDDVNQYCRNLSEMILKLTQRVRHLEDLLDDEDEDFIAPDGVIDLTGDSDVSDD